MGSSPIPGTRSRQHHAVGSAGGPEPTMSEPAQPTGGRPVALVTGAGRRIGIGAAVARRLAEDGFDVAVTDWSDYDDRMPWGADPDGRRALTAGLDGAGARHLELPADLEQPETTEALFDAVEAGLGAPTVLVLCHCESVDSGILDTTVESFDRHMAVNARATWLLIREFGRRYRAPHGAGRIVALTSDHTVHNLPYGASKAALDRITLAAAREFRDLGITANVVNPGAIDTGWMTAELRTQVIDATPLARLGEPGDVANLVSFLCSAEGGWVNGQLLTSDGGASA
jgi:3-oxoacyl-[acyl-carrier protein] reductase